MFYRLHSVCHIPTAGQHQSIASSLSEGVLILEEIGHGENAPVSQGFFGDVASFEDGIEGEETHLTVEEEALMRKRWMVLYIVR